MRRALALIALAAAVPAAAYLPPASAILKRVVQHRADVGASAQEVHGTLTLAGDAARRAPPAAGSPGPTGELAAPAIVLLKAPGRCRLELAPASVAPADRPAVSMRAGRVAGRRGLEDVPAARALVEAVCTLLAERATGGEADRALAQRLAERGIDLGQVSLGRVGTHVAWVFGSRQDQRPSAWIDKQSFQPVRLVAAVGGAPRDVRLLDFGSPVGGDAFPRAIEVWSGGQLEARFVTERAAANPRLPDSAFP